MTLSFFFNATATTEIYTLSLHDALPILSAGLPTGCFAGSGRLRRGSIGSSLASSRWGPGSDRKSTRLNSSHTVISYAVFCLKKKKKKTIFYKRPYESESGPVTNAILTEE